ncbi:MAG: ABC transporter ATP-binding protein, partial [Anaerolineales bacterium]|nr:ABC transporter ATP-binding protein [Anaerolineales bacterium]
MSIVQNPKAFLSTRTRKFFSYYQPYLGQLTINLIGAVLVSVTLLLVPLCIRLITKDLLTDVGPQTTAQIYRLGAVIFGLIALHLVGNTIVDYRGHMLGARMERDMRKELFAHFQTLSFGFYDSQKTGQLMSRITHDSFAMSELYHHGPEDLVISMLNFAGAFAILLAINGRLAAILFLLLPIMALYAVYFQRRLRRAMRQSKDRIGDINAQVEDALAGIREVQAFGNEVQEQEKFDHENERFLASRQIEYLSDAFYYQGVVFFTQVMPLVVVLFGGLAIIQAELDLADLITFLLYTGIMIEPILRFSNFTRLLQEGLTGFERFVEMLEVQPQIKNGTDAVSLDEVKGQIEFCNVTFGYQ